MHKKKYKMNSLKVYENIVLMGFFSDEECNYYRHILYETDHLLWYN